MISKFSVKKPYTVLVGVVFALILGAVAFTKMTADLLPSMNLPYVIVLTTYVGASPETVEEKVSKPVESSMATVSNIESISSVSNENYSMVILEFSQTANMDSVSLEISEKLDQIEGSFTDDLISNPLVMKLNPDMLPVMTVAAGMEGLEAAEVSEYIEEKIVPAIESVEGVASVSATGLIEESVNVIISPDKIEVINEQMKTAILDELEEASTKLAEGKEELEDAFDKVAEGEAELAKAQTELDEAKAELESGKTELESKQSTTITQLADGKAQLLTGKISMDATIATMNMDIATLQQLQTQIKAIEAAISSAASGGSDDTSQTATYADISDSTDQAAINPSAQLEALKTSAAVKSLMTVYHSDGVETYIAMLQAQVAALASQQTTVDNALKEMEVAENNAILGFASGLTQILLGQTELASAQTSLDEAKSELKATRTELENALEEIENGEEELEEGKTEALKQADMSKIINVDLVNGLLTAQNFSMPAGYVMEDGSSYLVRVGDKPESLEELKELPLLELHMEGIDTVTLEDVADVFYIDNSNEVYANINGLPGIMLSIQKQTGYATGEVSDALAQEFSELEAEHEGLLITALMDQGIYIDLVMDSILGNILVGAALAIIILLLFLRDIRPTFVVAISIPISLVTAIVLMYFTGITLNVISLAGLALGIGMLVDNSIVVIENIYRLRNEGYSIIEAAKEGAHEVSGAIIASTLTTVCVFLPIVFTEGMTKQLFVDMGLTIGYSLLASLVIALTVVPAMASKVLTKTKEHKTSKIFSKFIDIYAVVLKGCLKFKFLVILLVIGLLIGSVAAALTNGTAFMTDMDSTQLTVSVTLDKDADLEETKEVTDEVVEIIMAIDDVVDVGAMQSGSEMSMMGGGASDIVNATTIYVVVSEDKQLTNAEIGEEISQLTAHLDAEISVSSASMDMTALSGSGISVKIEGRDLDVLQSIALDVTELVSGVEGVKEVTNGLEDSSEELSIIVEKDKAVMYGLTVAQVYQQIAEKLAESSAATQLYEKDGEYGVYVSNKENEDLTRASLKEVLITGTNEDKEEVEISLSEIATFENTMSVNSIQRANQTRYMTVTASLEDDYNIGLVSVDVEKAVGTYVLPSGYDISFEGENEAIMDAMGQVGLMLVLAILFMYLIMVAQFQSLLSPFIIMFTIPLAFTGGFLGLFVAGAEVSVIALVGFVMLSGIIVNNGIVLIDYMNQLRESGMTKKEAIVEAGRTRLRPVLMTALTTILALSTMVFSSDMGGEMMQPMAIVTIGGLVYGTALTLIVIPCIYDLFIREKRNEIV